MTMAIFKILMVIYTMIYSTVSIGTDDRSTKIISIIGFTASSILLLAAYVLGVFYGG